MPNYTEKVLCKTIDRYLKENNSAYDILDDLSNMDALQSLTEEEYNKVTHHLNLELLDIDKFVKVNKLQPISNPVMYTKDNIPSDDGLLSNKIFGVTVDDRSGIFAYIDLHGYYIDPLIYKTWSRMDKNITAIVSRADTFSLDPRGYIVQDPNGSTGVDFLRKNIDKIKFKDSDSTSVRRDLKVKYLDINRHKMFINKYPVIPPFYRDTNSGTNKKVVGVNEINHLYQQLIIISNSMMQTQEYGFDLSGPNALRMQETLTTVYDWFSGTNSKNLQNPNTSGISGKMGVLRRASMSKTSDYAARLVISAPQLKVDNPSEMMANFEYTELPLSAAIACFEPFVQFNVRRFFENEFVGKNLYTVYDKKGNELHLTPKDPLVVFSDENIKTQMDQFIKGYTNRFIPIQVPMEENNNVYYMTFKGRFEEYNAANPVSHDIPESIYNRPLTWLDVLYVATVEATKDKMILITRYPVDTRSNEISTKCTITSTKDTEPMYYNNIYYKYYPKIDKNLIGTNTSNLFIDTMSMSNLYLSGMGADYDGDTICVRGVFTNEANDELKKFVKEKKNFIGLGGNNMRSAGKDTIQSLYSLTKVLSEDESKLSQPTY